MTKLDWQRRLKVLVWQNRRIVAVCSTVILAILLYMKFFVLENGGEAALALIIPFSLPSVGVALAFFVTVLVLLLDD